MSNTDVGGGLDWGEKQRCKRGDAMKADAELENPIYKPVQNRRTETRREQNQMRCRTACAACELWLSGCAPSPLLRGWTYEDGREGGLLGGCEIWGGVHSPFPFAGYVFGVLG